MSSQPETQTLDAERRLKTHLMFCARCKSPKLLKRGCKKFDRLWDAYSEQQASGVDLSTEGLEHGDSCGCGSH